MAGQSISHYTILDLLGQGGMGTVFRARDQRLDRLVAIKCLSPRMLGSPEARERILIEAKAISALNHPNIATIYEVEEQEGEIYLILEYLPGGSLASKIQALRARGLHLAIADVLALATDLAEGLAHAHRRGILHRDVKCANILFNAEDRPKITDFGLSKFLAASSPSTQITHPGVLAGTIAYMSPEQTRGEDLDHRSDMFSFGVVLYEMIAGRRPIEAEIDLALLRKIQTDVPRLLRSIREDVPEPLEKLVATLGAKRPEERYPSMDAVAAELRRLQQRPVDAASSAPTVSLVLPLPRPWPRRVWILGAAICLAALLPLFIPAVRARIAAWLHWRTVPAERHLAVLPFTNVGGDPANQAFCDGLTETLTTSLTQLERFSGSLFVVPASETRNFTDVRGVQKALAVNLALTGSVQREGGELRLTANLTDARTVRQISARTITARLGELPALQERVAVEIVEMLDLALQAETRTLLARGATTAAQASQAYLEGRGYLYRYDKGDNLDKAVENLERAVRLDARYAAAYASLAEACIRLYRRNASQAWLDKARAAALQAISLDDRLPAGRINLGVVHTVSREFDLAAREFQLALRLDPLNPSAYRELAASYEAAGRIRDAEDTYKKAAQMRPADWVSHSNLGVFYSKHSRPADAERSFLRVLDLTPDSHVTYRNLGGLYILMDRNDDAVRMLEKSTAIQPTGSAYSNLGALLIYQRRFRDAVSVLEKAVGTSSGRDLAFAYLVWGNLGDAHRGAGDSQKAGAAYAHAMGLAGAQLSARPQDPALLSAMAALAAKSADRTMADSYIRKARTLAPGDPTVNFRAALVFELAGRRDAALGALKDAIAAGYPWRDVANNPDLAPLRADRRFDTLVSQKPKDK